MADTTTARLTAIMESSREKMRSNTPLGKNEFEVVTRSFKNQIAEALPLALKDNAMRYVRQANICFAENPLLQKCTPISILGALIKASALGLELSSNLGQAYIVPYRRNKKIGGRFVEIYEAQLTLGFRGVMQLGYRSNKIALITADTVHTGDYFTYKKGLRRDLDHMPDDNVKPRDKSTMTHAYAIATYTNGGFEFEVWPTWRIEEHAEKYSQSYYKKDWKTGERVINPESPWHKHFMAMAKKTMILQIWKYLPLETDIARAAAFDHSVTTDAATIKGLTREADILETTPEYIDATEEAEEVVEEVTEMTEEKAKGE